MVIRKKGQLDSEWNMWEIYGKRYRYRGGGNSIATYCLRDDLKQVIWYDMIWYDMIWYDMIRQDKTRQDKTRQDKTT